MVVSGCGDPPLPPESDDSGADAGTVSDGGNTDAGGSDGNLPDTNVPDVNVPDVNVHDVNIPDTNAPDTNVPINPPPLASKPGLDITAGGTYSASASYSLIGAVGESPGGNNVSKSQHYALKAGVIAATQSN